MMRKDLSIILGLILAIFISQYYLLSDSLTLGFKPDDWILYFSYKLLGPDPLSKIISVWSERGIYTTYQVYYMGFLDSLVGFNYQAFHHINLIFKILATLSLYPLVQVLFRRKLLSFLAVLLFSIAPSAVGPLEFVVKGSDYLAIIWMNLFLLVYHLMISNKLKGWKYYFLLFVLLILSIAFSPIRIFPIMAVPLLVEAFLIFRYFNSDIIKKSFIRLSVLYLPFIFFLIHFQISLFGNSYGPVGILDQVLRGHWNLLLAPISGIGFSFIPDDFGAKIFGSIRTDTFQNYLYFTLGGPLVICGVLTATVVWSKISRGKLLFFILSTLLNFLFQILIFFFAFNNLKVPTSNPYTVIFGGYILILGSMIFLNWLKWGRSDRVLAAIWIGSAILLIFVFLTWAFAPLGTVFSGTSYYLVVASIGYSIMLAAFLVSIYDKLRSSRVKLLAFLTFLILVPIFGISSHTIRERFSSFNTDGLGAAGQIVMQQEARRVMKDLKVEDSALVYFDTSEISGHGPFYSEGFLTPFPVFMHFRENKIVDGCIGIIYEDSNLVELRKLVNVQNGITGFDYLSVCVSGGKSVVKNIFFTAKDFYAFKIKDKKLVDIKGSVLNRLNFFYSR